MEWTADQLNKLESNLMKLVDYATLTGILPVRDRLYALNRLLDVFQLASFQSYKSLDRQHCRSDLGVQRLHDTQFGLLPQVDDLDLASLQLEVLPSILSELLESASAAGLVDLSSTTECDLFDTRLMDCVTAPPSQVQAEFDALNKTNQHAATDWYYRFSKSTHYIRSERIAKDRHWVFDSPYGEIDITINRSKPEKDPKAIAAAGKAKATGYPACLLCATNEGYAGHLTHPARQNHRMIKLSLENGNWFMQYSPYVYYNEHAIFLHADHHPMKIDRHCFERLLDIVQVMPHYFVGSNADLPIVGGSILAHEHFQGGHYEFAMAKAPIDVPVTFDAYPDVKVGWVKWPMSVLRLNSLSREHMLDLADHILKTWRTYTDASCGIYAHTDGVPHNTITPIARRRGETYELDLVLRNNRTDEDHPMGIFHPRADYHHIKKENIGLIEVMGLAVLPARLHEELDWLKNALISDTISLDDPRIVSHYDWAINLTKTKTITPETVEQVLEQAVGDIFVKVLEDAGVYKLDHQGYLGKQAFVDACQ